MKLVLFILSATCVHAATNATVAPVPVPSSPYLPRIYRYVDALLENPKETINLHHYQNLLRLLYTLSELSGKPKYRDAADVALRSWLQQVPAPDAQISRPWMLWNRCFEIAPDASSRFALAVAENKTTNHPGFYLRTFGAAYAHTTNEVFLRAIETLLKPCERSESAPTLSFAIDCDGCARLLPEGLAARLRSLARRGDDAAARDDQAAMMFVSRYQNTGNIAHRDAIHALANAPLNSSADSLSPLTLGHAISLQLAAWRSNAGEQHLNKARAFADSALKKFFEGPAELVPGIDTLALSLAELHLHILYITAVRCPPNTIDR
jgi:hypothetical protein